MIAGKQMRPRQATSIVHILRRQPVLGRLGRCDVVGGPRIWQQGNLSLTSLHKQNTPQLTHCQNVDGSRSYRFSGPKPYLCDETDHRARCPMLFSSSGQSGDCILVVADSPGKTYHSSRALLHPHFPLVARARSPLAVTSVAVSVRSHVRADTGKLAQS